MKQLNIALAALAIMGSTSAQAADATLTFTGTIILPTCTPDTNTVTKTVPFGTAKTTDFAAVGSTKNATAFDLKLVSCAPNTNVTMTISGTSDTLTSVLKNTGTAAQVSVQLLKAQKSSDTIGTAITLGSASALGVVDGTNTMTIPMVGQFYRLGTMSGGTVSAVATANFQYN